MSSRLRTLTAALASTGLIACATEPPVDTAIPSPDPPVIYAIPAPPSPNPFKKEEAAKESEPARLKEETLRRIAQVFGKIKGDYVDEVEETRLIDACRTKMLDLIPDEKSAATATVGGKAGLRQLLDTLNYVRTRTGGRLDDEIIADTCIRGMMAVLDRSDYLDPEKFRELQVTDDTGGIGLEFDAKSMPIVVVDTIDDSPASRIYLQKGDLITEIDGEPLAQLTTDDALKRLRGKAGSTIRLKVERPGQTEPMQLTLVREIVRRKSVKWARLAPGIAYVRVTQFSEHTVSLLAETVTAAYAANDGTLSGLVLDLRKNSGGLLNTSVGVAAAFLPSDVLVASTKGRHPDSNLQLRANKEFYVRGSRNDPLERLPPALKRIPIVVLVDSATASGAEIVAAALQDHARATVMGQRTFGLDLIQTIFPIGDGSALKLTTARFYRASGKALGKGVDPDIVLPATEDTSPYPIARIGQDPEVRAALKNLAAVSASN